VVKEPYTKDNRIRVANDKAFKDGVIKLLESLQSWNGSNRLRLELELLGRKQVLEPGTKKSGLSETITIVNGVTVSLNPIALDFPNTKS
jgi:hypothetical protein